MFDPSAARPTPDPASPVAPSPFAAILQTAREAGQSARGEQAGARHWYRGYVTTPVWSEEDRRWHGRIEGIRDVVTYESADGPGVAQAFRESVDGYLASCEAQGRAPEVPPPPHVP